jgi:hypothetical protein
VSREAKDILLKYIADALRGDFPAALGLDLPPIVEPLPAELPTLEVRAEQPDRFYRLADTTILSLHRPLGALSPGVPDDGGRG